MEGEHEIMAGREAIWAACSWQQQKSAETAF